MDRISIQVKNIYYSEWKSIDDGAKVFHRNWMTLTFSISIFRFFFFLHLMRSRCKNAAISIRCETCRASMFVWDVAGSGFLQYLKLATHFYAEPKAIASCTNTE